ncbi:rhomboid domain-containing protein 2 [Alligator mississippiensis]|uniref:rhomboid domain-containing protein 2 n=1 Tax=Alligator mississippiensis TaxID=8496 RepID=UPI0003D0B90E|nr:rhomboid domain-containing protein 2 [Alligator mississippiensis]
MAAPGRGCRWRGEAWPRVPAAAFLTALLSLAVSGPGLLRGAGAAAPSAFSLRPGAVRGGEVHRLVTFIFVYEDLISLACGAVIVWYFAGSFEKNVGTVKHCFLTVAFAISSALLSLCLEAVFSQLSGVEDAKGFIPVAFAMFGVSTTRSRMRRALLFGFNVPVVLVPWIMLCMTWFIPRSSLLGNTCGLLVGVAYGLGYCFCLDLPESIVSRLDQKLPFCLLKRIPGLKYIPGSLAERRASQSKKINPVPGSYPTQSYYCPSPPALPTTQIQHPNAQSLESWHSYTPGYIHAPAPYQTSTAFGEFYIQNHFGASSGHGCQPPDSASLQHKGLPYSQMFAGLENLEAKLQQAPGLPAGAATSPELSEIQIY